MESVQNQTLRNVELVAVDAGSEDGSARMLDVAAERDMRVSVEHVPPCTREAALDLALSHARGEHVTVMDADGWLEPTFLQRLVETAEGGHVDLVVASAEVEISTPRRSVELRCPDAEAIYRTQHDFRAAAWQHLASGLLAPASAKLFDRGRAVAEGLKFDSGSGTDHGFTYGYLREIERVAIVGGGYRVQRDVELGGVESARRLYRGLGREHEAVRSLLADWGLEGDAASVATLQGRYLELLSQCISIACDIRSGEKPEEVRALVGQMISDDRARLAASVGQPSDGAARALVGPIKGQNVSLAIMQARLFSVARRGAPAVLAPDAFI